MILFVLFFSLFNLFDFTKNARLWPPGAFQFFNSFNVTRKKHTFKKQVNALKHNIFFSFNLCICIFKIYLSYINIFILHNLFYLLKWSDFGLLGHLTGKNQLNTNNEKWYHSLICGTYFLCLT